MVVRVVDKLPGSTGEQPVGHSEGSEEAPLMENCRYTSVVTQGSQPPKSE